jgi:hypothetical protein
MSEDEGDDFEQQLGDVQSRAEKLGVSGSGGDSEPTPADVDTEDSDDADSQQSTQQTPETIGAVDAHEYPNPDRELGALSDVYENNNVFLSPAVVDEVGELWDDIEYEWKKANDTELSKNWDFYMACFRVLLNNPDLVREELGMDTE